MVSAELADTTQRDVSPSRLGSLLARIYEAHGHACNCETGNKPPHTIP